MPKQRFYVIIKGRSIGIFDRWDGGARPKVDGYPNALYKSFSTVELAELWWAQQMPNQAPCFYFERTPQASSETSETGHFFTYLIVDPRSGLPFYVGQTTCMERRKHGHLRVRVGAKRRSKQIIAEIVSAGLEPEFRVVDEQSTEAASLQSETEWVKRLARQGIQVVNRWREHAEWLEMVRSQQARPLGQPIVK